MPIQIEQKIPRCLRCGNVVHVHAAERIEDQQGRLFCSRTCQEEYLGLSNDSDDESAP